MGAFYKNFEMINFSCFQNDLFKLEMLTEENSAKRNKIQIEHILICGLFIDTQCMFLCDHATIFMFCACIEKGAGSKVFHFGHK